MTKTKLQTIFLTAAMALCLAVPAHAQKLTVKDEGEGKYAYLKESGVKEIMARFPAPPAAGSAQERKDKLEVLDWQTARTDQQCEAAMKQEDVKLTGFFTGDAYPFEGQPPEVLEFFKKTGADMRLACRLMKNHFKRPRPSDPSIIYCTQEVGSKYSYPSRHAATAFLFAIILSELDPANREKYLQAADRSGQYRVIAGVHYPTDLIAGSNFARDLYPEFNQNPNFQKDLQSLRKYLKKKPAKKK